MLRLKMGRACALLPLLSAPLAHAGEIALDVATTAAAGNDDLTAVTVTDRRATTAAADYPATVVSVDQRQVRESVNAVDAEDAARYLPGIFIRKRNYGDTQPVLATRDWGVNSSARTLVYVDDIPVSALVANNNTIGAPRFGMVSPEQIERIDMLYGPYASEYSGNSMGGVMRIVTRMPEQTEFSFDQVGALQSFNLYGTDRSFGTSQTSATAAGRTGDLSWFLGGSFLDSVSQPLSLVTGSTAPAGTSGAIVADNKTGQQADVLGAGGLLQVREANILLRLGYDLTPVWRVTWLADFWRNVAHADVSTYLVDAQGKPTFGRVAGFASNRYQLLENHVMNGVSLKPDSRGEWDGEAVVTFYDFLQDRQLSPAGVSTGTDFTTNGRLADYGGTQWGTADLKGVWRPLGFDGPQALSFGAHADRYVLDNPTWNTVGWTELAGVHGSLYSSGRGRTETQALWFTDQWTLTPQWRATVGARLEHWRADEGYNYSGTTGVAQPAEAAYALSPKATLSWQPGADWTLTGSVARAVRFPTVSELYQLVSTGSTYTSPNPDLAPEKDIIGELAVACAFKGGSARLSLFQENTRDALISQTSMLAGYAAPVTYVQNVGEVRNRGVELAGQEAGLLAGFDVSGSVTFVDSTILSDSAFASSAGTTATGRHAPYVPRWRATLVTTYRPAPGWAVTLAGRYSGQQYSTLDNTDNTPQVFGAFDSFLVLDARVHWEATDHLAVSLGVDNLTDRIYFIYHPFPQRTVVADLHFRF